MDGPQFLDGLVASITGILSGGYGRLSPELRSLFSTIVGFDLILAALAWCAAYLEVFQRLIGSLLKLFVWVMLFTAYPVLSQTFVEYCIWGGLTAGGIASGGQLTVEEFQRPSTVLMKSFEATAPINTFIERHTGWAMMKNFWTLGAMAFGALGLWFAFVFMAIHLVFVQIALWIALAIVPIFLVFGPLAFTAFLAQRGFALVIAAAARLGIAALLTALMFPFVDQFFMEPGVDPDIYAGAWICIGAWLIALLSWIIPAIAHSFFAGGPLLSLGTLIPGLALLRGVGRASSGSAPRTTNVTYRTTVQATTGSGLPPQRGTYL